MRNTRTYLTEVIPLAKLALRVDSFESEMSLATGTFTFDRHLLTLVGQRIGDMVLFYRETGFGGIVFIAHAFLRGIDGLDDEEWKLVARLTDMKFFEVPASGETGVDAGNQGFVRVSRERFGEILAEVDGDAGDDFTLREQYSIFLDAPSTETYLAVHKLALERADYTCAFTGQVFQHLEGIHPDLNVSAIHPLGDGGSLHTSNFLVLSKTAAEAFNRGHLTVSGDYSLIADLSAIDPELLEALNPLGRLILSSNRDFWPDLDQLAYHRQFIFGGKLY